MKPLKVHFLVLVKKLNKENKIQNLGLDLCLHRKNVALVLLILLPQQQEEEVVVESEADPAHQLAPGQGGFGHLFHGDGRRRRCRGGADVGTKEGERLGGVERRWGCWGMESGVR